MAAPDPKTVAFEKYISDKKILIADPGATTRANLASTLFKLGAKTTNIALAGKIADAHTEMDRIKPHVVIADYQIAMLYL